MRRSPYLRTRKIAGGAIALVRRAEGFTVNVWTEDDDSFRDVEIAEHGNSPATRRHALATARELYLWIIETGIGALELADMMEPAA